MTTKFNKCDLSNCQGMCCYDGVYLDDEDIVKLNKIVNDNKSFFSFLPKDYITDGSWENMRGVKTQVKPFKYKKIPSHFNNTRCVFALKDARCSLQVLAEDKKIHKWSLKPKGCWMHPLTLTNGEPTPPPKDKADDKYNLGVNYPGYACYTECGKHNENGQDWKEVLKEEIDYIKIVEIK